MSFQLKIQKKRKKQKDLYQQIQTATQIYSRTDAKGKITFPAKKKLLHSPAAPRCV